MSGNILEKKHNFSKIGNLLIRRIMVYWIAKKRKRGLPMKKTNQLSEAAFQLDGKMPLKQAIPLGLQHVLAMFVGNLTPLLIITGTWYCQR